MMQGGKIGAGVVRCAPEAVQKRLDAEAERMAAMKDAAPPGLPFGPGRGAVRLVRDVVALPGGTRRHVGNHWEEADQFDAMCRAAVLRHERAGGEGVAVLPFTTGQMWVARLYRALVERHSSGGVRCVQLDGARGGGGDFMDAHLDIARRIDGLRRAIGGGSAMVLRRIRPSVRGSRHGITDRAVVDAVCLGGKSLSQVLAGHGWACKGEHREALRLALASALDRMQGYRE